MNAENFRIGNLINLKKWQDEISFFSDFEATQDQIDAIVNSGDVYF